MESPGPPPLYTPAISQDASIVDEDDQLLLCQDGYAWDYVLVFPALPQPMSPLGEVFHRLHLPTKKAKTTTPTVDEICYRLTKAGLTLKLACPSAPSSSRHLFCLVRGSRQILAREADRIDLLMPMNKDKLRDASHRGFPSCGIAPFPIDDPLHQFKLSPYDSIYFRYTCRDDMQPLYAKQGPHDALFTSSQRILLLESIMTNRHGGAGLNLAKLKHSNVVTTYFSLHDVAELSRVTTSWLQWGQYPWQQPLHAIQRYFGSRIGLYFAFLGYYTTWLIGAGAVGLVLWLVELSDRLPKDIVVAITSTLVIIWATIFLKSWKRRAARLALEWGTSNFSTLEQVRPQYVGQMLPSPVTGQPMLYFSKREKSRRRCLTWLLLTCLIALVAAVVTAIFYLQFVMLERGYSIRVGPTEVVLAGPVTSVANIVQIHAMYYVYNQLCEAMNEYENHRTQSSHEGSFIVKSVLFHAVNNFAGLFYITFVKTYVGAACAGNDCMGELRLYLLMIFCFQLANGLVHDWVVPHVRVLYSQCRARGTSAAVSSKVEAQFYLLDYSWRVTFNEYLGLAMKFGFTILFLGASPAMSLLTLLNNLIELRSDSTNLVMNHRRPLPRQASTCGQWTTVLEYLVTLSILTNGYDLLVLKKVHEPENRRFVVVYASNALVVNTNDPGASLVQLRAFGGFVTAMLVVRYGVTTWIKDVPHDVAIQLKRQAFLATKVYVREADDVVPVYESTGSVRLLPVDSASPV
ncbi:hypothetical protein DYB37_008994 [Aphanomyces astaci]|uniref:Anoctamin dimerisation domain-containing protein n=1 Tax=Aphanomyces astaci TaxID=112090 RepID=A0A418DVK1_APHAT|nr:hypothetical protein DYB35_003873 [Aphanomyces astaci]RHZ15186.1 hypothetical protein DYB37_008994 [Aphanomyces astaci]